MIKRWEFWEQLIENSYPISKSEAFQTKLDGRKKKCIQNEGWTNFTTQKGADCTNKSFKSTVGLNSYLKTLNIKNLKKNFQRWKKSQHNVWNLGAETDSSFCKKKEKNPFSKEKR